MSGRKETLISFYLVLLDAAVLGLSYILALNLYTWITGRESANAETAVLIIFASFLLVSLLFNTNRYFLKRSKLEELTAEFKFFIIYGALLAIILYVFHAMEEMSRIVTGFTLLIFFIADYFLRLLLKKILIRHMPDTRTQMLLITTADWAEPVIEKILASGQYSHIDALVILDQDLKGKTLGEVPVVAGKQDLFDYALQNVVDEAFVILPDSEENMISDIINELGSMGVSVHVVLDEFSSLEGFIRRVDTVGEYPVLNFSMSEQDPKKLMIKRAFDILIGLIGSFFTLILMLFIAPAIKIESKGPVFFKQMRVGRNGRLFKMYKFRSMYADAEERKKELQKQNEIAGPMFKITDDPRITKVGKFLRATSLDEFPQFFNILKNDMSLIGTRPPTVDEFRLYQEHHKRRLSMKPGLTGMWQVSGRSTITDFEEVVRLDCYYIDHWSLALDTKIFFKTIVAVFTRRGSK